MARRRARVPLDWAVTQHNLGNAPRSLGGRDGGIIALEEAVAAYDVKLVLLNDAGAAHYARVVGRNRRLALRLIADRHTL